MIDISSILTYGYIGIFIIVFLESGIFFPLPADSLLFSAGLLVGVYDLNILVLVLVIFIATHTGALAGYFIGEHLEKLRKKTFFQKIIKESHILRTQEFFIKHGKFTILISRFIPIVRTFTPIVAGLARMNRHLFRRYSLLGSLIWASSIPLLGYLLGRAFPWLQNYLEIIAIVIILVSFLPIIWKAQRKQI